MTTTRASSRRRRAASRPLEVEKPPPARPLSPWWGALPAVLALAGVALFLRGQQAVTGNLWGVPLDDAYIHFQFARNLATGHGFSFNPDQPIPGSTSPLWVVLLAALSLLGLPLWLVAKALGIMALAAAAVLAWRLALPLVATPVAALAVGALTALDGRLLWAAPSGMEVTLFAALCLAAFLARPTNGGPGATRRFLLVAALCGLATLTRPEGYLLTAVLAVDLYVRFRPSWRIVAAGAALYVALAAPYVVFCLLTTGHPLPTTFYAKASPLGAGTLPNAGQYALGFIYYLFLTNAAMALLAPVGAVVLWRQGGAARAIVAWPLLLAVEQALLSPALYHFGRYVMPLEPFFALWAVVGIGRFTRVSASGETVRRALPALALVVVGVFTLNLWVGTYAYSVQNIDAMHVVLGRWVKRHVPAGVPVALNDIGAITYVSQHPAVDIEGLVTPSFLAIKREQPDARRARDTLAALKRDGARYLIIFPKAYSDLAREPGLQRVYSITLHHVVIVPAATMVVYRVR